MNLSKLIITLSCLLTALACSAAKYQIKVLNTPAITIDNRQAKVGDWFNDESVIVWSRDNQAMRVVSDENKVYTLSAKLYKESKAKKFSDFILYTKPLAARGTNNLDLIEQLAERFDNTFIMLDEIVIDLSKTDIRDHDYFIFEWKGDDSRFYHSSIMVPHNQQLLIKRNDIVVTSNAEACVTLKITIYPLGRIASLISESFEIEILPLSL